MHYTWHSIHIHVINYTYNKMFTCYKAYTMYNLSYELNMLIVYVNIIT